MDKRKLIEYIIMGLLTVTVVVLVILLLNRKKTEVIERQVVVENVVTDVKYDTVYFTNVKTVKLPVHDTVTLVKDSLFTIVDSVMVDVPISKYITDTTFTTDTTKLNIYLSIKGYDVEIDTLAYKFDYRYKVVQPKRNFFKEHFRVGLGFGLNYDLIHKTWGVGPQAGFYFVF